MSKQLIYQLSICARIGLQAHSMSNIGTNGSIRTEGRRQMLADGTVVDAISGNILKHHHARLLAEIFDEWGVHLCEACAKHNVNRAGALVGQPGYENFDIDWALKCGLCDTHGFMALSQHPFHKESLIQYPLVLALREQWREEVQLFTRSRPPMKIKVPVRSGIYALCLRYNSVGVGLDTEGWRLVVDNDEERVKRHQGILLALCDSILSPEGAKMATMLPHFDELQGVIVVQSQVGRVPICSPEKDNYIAQLKSLKNDFRQIFTFDDIDQFNQIMTELVGNSAPYLPTRFRQGCVVA